MNFKIRTTPCGSEEIYYFYDFLVYLDFLIRNKRKNDKLVKDNSEKFLLLRLLHLDESLNNKDNIAIHIVSIKPNLIEANILHTVIKKQWIIQVNEYDDISILSVSNKEINL